MSSSTFTRLDKKKSWHSSLRVKKWIQIKNKRLDSEGHLLNLKSPRSFLIVRESLPDNEFPESAEVISNRVFGEVDDESHLNSQFPIVSA